MIHELGKPSIYLAMPCADGTARVMSVLAAVQQASSRGLRVTYGYQGGSCLMHVFNQLWVQAQGGAEQGLVTHFAMLHNDVGADPNWLDVLLDEMNRTGADVVSAVCAIKDLKGITSTAVGSPDDIFDYRRVTTSEVQKLPATFDMSDVARLWAKSELTDGKCLLVNTGCMLVDLRKPYWHRADAAGNMEFAFQQVTRIQRWPNGTWSPEFAPEDWLMSRFVHKQGGKCVATTKVKTRHFGDQIYPNDAAWGQATDVEIDAFWRSRVEAYGHATATPIEDEGGMTVGAAAAPVASVVASGLEPESQEASTCSA